MGNLARHYSMSDGMAHKTVREEEMAASIPLDPQNAARKVIDVFARPGGWFVDSVGIVARSTVKRDAIAKVVSGIEAEMEIADRRHNAIVKAMDAIEALRSLELECAEDESVAGALDRILAARTAASVEIGRIASRRDAELKKLERANAELRTASVANEIVGTCNEILESAPGRCIALARRMRARLRDFYDAATSGGDARPDEVTSERGELERLNARTFAKVLRGAMF